MGADVGSPQVAVERPLSLEEVYLEQQKGVSSGAGSEVSPGMISVTRKTAELNVCVTFVVVGC